MRNKRKSQIKGYRAGMFTPYYATEFKKKGKNYTIAKVSVAKRTLTTDLEYSNSTDSFNTGNNPP